MPRIPGNELRGMGYPIAKGREGYWPRRNSKALRLSSLVNILGTMKGERVMMPEFGSDLHKLLFEPNDPLFRARISEETINAVQKWDPNLRVVNVAPESNGNISELSLFIDYIDDSDPNSEPRSLVVDLNRG